MRLYIIAKLLNMCHKTHNIHYVFENILNCFNLQISLLIKTKISTLSISQRKNNVCDALISADHKSYQVPS